MFLELNTQAANIYLVFFGFYDLLIGYLIFRSAFLPRILGVLMAIAGLGWLTFLAPPLANYLSPYILVLGFVAELLLMLWLLLKGVNVQRWKEQASAAAIVREAGKENEHSYAILVRVLLFVVFLQFTLSGRAHGQQSTPDDQVIRVNVELLEVAPRRIPALHHRA